MYFFDKKTEYLIWNSIEGQARGVGTARFVVMDEVCRMDVSVTDCGKVQGTYSVYLLSGHLQSLVGEMIFIKGKGNFSIKGKSSALGDQRIPYTQVTGVHIDLKTEGNLEKKWLPVQGNLVEEPKREAVRGKQESEQNQQSAEESQNKWEQRQSKQSEERTQDKQEQKWNEHGKKLQGMGELKQNMLQSQEPYHVQSQERQQRNESEQQNQGARSLQEMQEKLRDQEQKKQQGNVSDPVSPKPPAKEGFQLYTDKWKQLCAIYPIVHPFGDGRAYLSIEPRDFVILQERFQPMVQNSFLLHGFYHYRHLLLGRSRQGNHPQYYLGVPGVFYEKEKSAALFYGFESFEGAMMPAAEGSFGYYMKRVQL